MVLHRVGEKLAETTVAGHCGAKTSLPPVTDYQGTTDFIIVATEISILTLLVENTDDQPIVRMKRPGPTRMVNIMMIGGTDGNGKNEEENASAFVATMMIQRTKNHRRRRHREAYRRRVVAVGTEKRNTKRRNRHRMRGTMTRRAPKGSVDTKRSITVVADHRRRVVAAKCAYI
jgi:hypothetical protein